MVCCPNCEPNTTGFQVHFIRPHEGEELCIPSGARPYSSRSSSSPPSYSVSLPLTYSSPSLPRLASGSQGCVGASASTQDGTSICEFSASQAGSMNSRRILSLLFAGFGRSLSRFSPTTMGTMKFFQSALLCLTASLIRLTFSLTCKHD
jgi:hypothetical protein